MSKIIVAVLVLLGFGLISSMYTVDEREKALLFSLGEIKNAELTPGLHFKFPLVNNVIKFDSRLLTLDADPERFLTIEKKNVIVDFFVKWRIENAAQYYRSTRGQEITAQSRLSQIIKDGLRNEFARRTIQQAVSGERGEIMSAINKSSKSIAAALGIGVEDVRLSRIDLPDEVSDSVYDRMRAERARIAKELRAQGKEASERIRASADRQREVILADAYKEAQQTRGSGDAKAAEVFANAYNKNAEFYSFYRSMEAYRNAFKDKSDLMVLEPDSAFFSYFKSPTGKPGSAPAKAPAPPAQLPEAQTFEPSQLPKPVPGPVVAPSAQ
jgi:membrane protease subunit HflC